MRVFRLYTPYALLVFLLWAWIPAQTLAWTKAAITSAKVELELQATGRLQVQMRLSVSVYAGNVHSLELAGLGKGVGLHDIISAVWIDNVGKRYVPTIEEKADSHFLLEFADDRSPSQGNYVCLINYRSQLNFDQAEAKSDQQIQVAWTLPGWKYNLQDVQIVIRAPLGSSARTPSDASAQNISIQESSEGEHSRLAWTRTHLLRETPWTVYFFVPRAGFAAGILSQGALSPTLLALPAESSPSAKAQNTRSETVSHGWLSTRPVFFSLLLVIIYALKQILWLYTVRFAGEQAYANRVGVTCAYVGGAFVCAAIAAVVFIQAPRWSWILWTAIACVGTFALQMQMRTVHCTSLSAQSVVEQKANFDARRLLLWFDGSTGYGLLLLATLISALCVLPIFDRVDHLLAALLVLPCFLTGTRFSVPASMHGQQSFLDEWIEGRSWWFLEKKGQIINDGASGRTLEFAYFLSSEQLAPGTLKLVLRPDSRPIGPLRTTGLQLTLLTRMSSEASDILKRILSTPNQEDPTRGILVWSANDANSITRVLRNLRKVPR